VWREKAAALDPGRADGAPADLKALESLAAEASRIHVALPEAKARARARAGRRPVPACLREGHAAVKSSLWRRVLDMMDARRCMHI